MEVETRSDGAEARTGVETEKSFREENSSKKRSEQISDLCNKRMNLKDESAQTFFSVLKKKSLTLKKNIRI